MKDNKKKYFFVCFSGVVTKELKQQMDSDDNIPGIENSIQENIKIPIPFIGSEIVTSEHGLFLPFQIESYISSTYKLDQCKLTFVREMSEDEVEFERKNVTSEDKPIPIKKSVENEIDELISAAENGNLRVNVNPNSEKNHNEEKGLEGLGGLFNANPWGDE